ncbi:MAG: isoquinoline 1-oxidoreductase [Myxococcales bacterium FL481]|nr:MAG: isoquinoline 1-oxidoreductase [Myxococcales bacterium FL481]
MHEHDDDLDLVEPERYELLERPAYRFDVGRRGFFRGLGGGLFVGATFAGTPNGASARPSEPTGSTRPRPARREDLSAWLHIAKDETITIYSGRVEMGQGIRTSFAQLVAEELPAPLDQFRVVVGDTALCPYDRGTWGSQSVPRQSPILRRVGATARQLLLELASQHFDVPSGELEIAAGSVTHTASGDSATFGALVDGEELEAVVEDDVDVIPASDWKLAGTPVPKVGARAFVTGEHVYTSDLRPDGLQYGMVLRPPSFGADLTTVDTSLAEAMDGVTVVKDGDFVGVVAPDPGTAEAAIASIDATWNESREDRGVTDTQFSRLESRPVERMAWRTRTETHRGDVSSGLAEAAHVVRATYRIPYIAHVPLETRSGVAQWTGSNKLDLWAGTQSPFGNREDLAQKFGLSEANVRVQVPDMGSGYGGKTSSESAIEVARLAKAVDGPVKLHWTREEEFTWAYFRPAASINARVGVDARGRLVAWEQTTHNGGLTGLDCQYRVANEHRRFQPARADLRQGSYRAVGSTANKFAAESATDEAAHAAGKDPLEFRRDNLDDARLIDVMEAAVEAFDWGADKPNGHGFGLAVCKDKGGAICNCVEVAVGDEGEVTIVRIISAFEAGPIINPAEVEAQIEGSVIMGIGGALWEVIEYGDGKIHNPRLSQYRVPRFSDIPPMQTILLDRRDRSPSGAGECGIVAIAPALANAIFDATGERIRQLPLEAGLRRRIGQRQRR